MINLDNMKTATDLQTFRNSIRLGIPEALPPPRKRDESLSHAPVRKDILSDEEKKLALRNALRYFPKEWHTELAPEFLDELRSLGRIYMYRFKPDYPMFARPVSEYPAKNPAAAAIMLMIQNNLDPKVAQHPEELTADQPRGVRHVLVNGVPIRSDERSLLGSQQERPGTRPELV